MVAGTITEADWASKQNAILPYDFVVVLPSSQRQRIKVTATRGPFRLPLHISLSEFRNAADSQGPYCVYRIYGLDENRAYLRIRRFPAVRQ